MNALEISNLTKKYVGITAVDNLSIEVPEGSIFGILGPNGSGKTTTLACVTGLVEQSSGIFKWFNNAENQTDNKLIGAIVETPNFFPNFTAYKNMQLVAKIKGVENSQEIDSLLHRLGIYDRRNSQFYTFSLGMKSRLALASALLGNPKVLILDEPTNGLDPEGIAFVRNLIIEEAQKSKTIILASHILDEVQKVCTDIVLLKNGKMLACGKINEILSVKNTYIIESDDNSLLSELIVRGGLANVLNSNNKLIEISVSSQQEIKEISKIAALNNILITKLSEKQNSLEDEFLKLVK